tara:strand:- start:85 stop:201 length:117 start_codon:yes stop_codon:yes gene_type:complete
MKTASRSVRGCIPLSIYWLKMFGEMLGIFENVVGMGSI